MSEFVTRQLVAVSIKLTETRKHEKNISFIVPQRENVKEFIERTFVFVVNQGVMTYLQMISWYFKMLRAAD